MKLTPEKVEKALRVLRAHEKVRWQEILEKCNARHDQLNVGLEYDGESAMMPIVLLSDGTWKFAEEYFAELESEPPVSA